MKERKVKEICKGQGQILIAGAKSEALRKGLQGNRELPSASNSPRPWLFSLLLPLAPAFYPMNLALGLLIHYLFCTFSPTNLQTSPQPLNKENPKTQPPHIFTIKLFLGLILWSKSSQDRNTEMRRIFCSALKTPRLPLSWTSIKFAHSLFFTSLRCDSLVSFTEFISRSDVPKINI